MVKCSVLTDPEFIADELLNWEASDSRLKGLGRSSQRNSAELGRAKKRIAELLRAVQGHKSRSWKETLGVEQGQSTASTESPKSERSSGANSPKRQEGRTE